jgi:HPt (histidine-containing phosphotransfer) domain-containing protein
MNRTPSMSAEVRRALDERWPRVRDAARVHLKLIEEGGNPAQRSAARGAAHKLSGSLGMFGRRDASSVALAIEDLLGSDLTASGRRQLRTLVAQLEQMIGPDDSSPGC